jgi:multidrug efflux system membrane fusion protein
MYSRVSHLATFAAALVLAVAASACTSPAAETNTSGGGNQGPVPVTVGTVTRQDIPLDLQVIGAVEPLQTVQITTQVTGIITSVNFKEGDDVSKDQVLFMLDRRPLEAAQAQAKANLARDSAQAANARSSAERYKDLFARGIATKDQTDTAGANAEALDATVEADRAAVNNATVQLEYATIRAPLEGRTGALMVHAGSLVVAGTGVPLVVINQVSPISVGFGIPESQLPDLKRYMAKGAVAVTAQPPNDAARPEKGTVAFIDNSVDRNTGTIKVKGTFANTTHRLWPGQFVNVAMILATIPSAITVPSTSVQAGPQGSFVYVVKVDKTAEMRPVTVDRTRGDISIIRSGLQPGETIVTDGQLRLTPGSAITVKSPEAQTKAAS